MTIEDFVRLLEGLELFEELSPFLPHGKYNKFAANQKSKLIIYSTSKNCARTRRHLFGLGSGVFEW